MRLQWNMLDAFRPRMLAVGLVLIAGLAAAVFWLSPMARPLRYEGMSLLDLRRETRRDASNFEAWKALGLRLAAAGDGGMAEPALRSAFALDPGDPEPATALGEILIERREYPEAFQVLKTAVDENPGFPLARMALGRLHRRRGAYHLAVEQFKAVVESRSDFPDAWAQLATCYLQMQQVARAEEAISRALEAEPEQPEYLLIEAATLAAVGKHREARGAMERATAARPGDPSLQARYATMLLAHYEKPEDLERAESLLKALQKSAPDHPLLPYLRGQLAVHRGQWAAAVPLLERARALTPGQDEVHYALAQAYRRVGRAAEADRALSNYRKNQSLRREIDELRIQLAVVDARTPIYLRLAELQMEAGDRAGAIVSLQTASQLDPDNAKLKKEMARLQGTPSANAR